MITLYWLLRRAHLRHQWNAGRLNCGQFMVALHHAPRWVARDTESYAKKLRRFVRRALAS